MFITCGKKASQLQENTITEQGKLFESATSWRPSVFLWTVAMASTSPPFATVWVPLMMNNVLLFQATACIVFPNNPLTYTYTFTIVDFMFKARIPHIDSTFSYISKNLKIEHNLLIKVDKLSFAIECHIVAPSSIPQTYTQFLSQSHTQSADLHPLLQNVQITPLPRLHPRILLHLVSTPQPRAKPPLPQRARLRSKSNHFCSFHICQPQGPGNRLTRNHCN